MIHGSLIDHPHPRSLTCEGAGACPGVADGHVGVAGTGVQPHRHLRLPVAGVVGGAHRVQHGAGRMPQTLVEGGREQLLHRGRESPDDVLLLVASVEEALDPARVRRAEDLGRVLVEGVQTVLRDQPVGEVEDPADVVDPAVEQPGHLLALAVVRTADRRQRLQPEVPVGAPVQRLAERHRDLAALREARHVDVPGERTREPVRGRPRGAQHVEGRGHRRGGVHVRMPARAPAEAEVVGGGHGTARARVQIRRHPPEVLARRGRVVAVDHRAVGVGDQVEAVAAALGERQQPGRGGGCTLRIDGPVRQPVRPYAVPHGVRGDVPPAQERPDGPRVPVGDRGDGDQLPAPRPVRPLTAGSCHRSRGERGEQQGRRSGESPPRAPTRLCSMGCARLITHVLDARDAQVMPTSESPPHPWWT